MTAAPAESAVPAPVVRADAPPAGAARGARGRLTLAHVFALAIVGLTALPALLFAVARASRQAILEGSDRLREGAAREVAGRVEAYLDRAPDAVLDLEAAIRAGLVGIDNPLSVEAALFGRMLAEPGLSELTFTAAGDGAGSAAGSAPSSFQVALMRAAGPSGERVVTRRLEQVDGRWLARLRLRPPGGGLTSAPLAEVRGDGAPLGDPRGEPTYATPASERFRGQTLWSDLHWSRLPWADLARGASPEAPLEAEPAPVVVVSAQRAISDDAGRLIGVVRASLRADALDGLVALAADPARGLDAHSVFLFDPGTRLLVTRPRADAAYVEAEGREGPELRVPLGAAPPEVALAVEACASAPAGDAPGEGAAGRAPRVRYEASGEVFVATARPLAGGRGWAVGVVAPERFYLGDLAWRLRWWAGTALVLLGVAVSGGALVLVSVRRGLAALTDETARIERFDFESRSSASPFEEVAAVRGGLEGAKAALRAMGRYVPVELVRTLLRSRREPALGGAMRDVTILFTDIEGFTGICEGLPPDRLARALGAYFEHMTRAIHAHGGTIDKYIGDSVMALWNAPSPLDGHATAACRAALACEQAIAELCASPQWEGLPPFRTRFGIHRADVLVGHFGSPERMSYTALGDGVNVAARFEGLNKLYETRILVSQAVYDEARGELAFRLIDRVAVKGRQGGLDVYELLGRAGEGREERALEYEDALALYFQRSFVRARVLFEAHPEDGPSRTMAARCRALVEHPPSMDWDGVFAAALK